MKKLGLYIHIPFCIKKCKYCDFVSSSINKSLITRYTKALIEEIKFHKNVLEEYSINTIFIGGGTPSAIDVKEIATIIESIHKYLKVAPKIEFTIETNPGTLSAEKIKKYKEFGINRISMGVQSFNDKILKFIGRIHSQKEVLESYYLAQNNGFDNINIDLMYGLPHQSLNDWQDTLKKAIKLEPQHISAYSLKLEENTKFYEMYKNKEFKMPEDEVDRKMHHICIEFLDQHGLKQYEISNFAKKGYECKHNLIYWNNEEYLGLGVSAHSYFNNVRLANTNSIKEYIDLIDRGKSPISYKEDIGRKDEIFETIFLGLRLKKGINIDEFQKRFNESIFNIYKEVLQDLSNKKLIEINNKHIKLTPYGIDISNQVFAEFFLR